MKTMLKRILSVIGAVAVVISAASLPVVGNAITKEAAEAKKAYLDFLSEDSWIYGVSGKLTKEMAVFDMKKDGVPEVTAICHDQNNNYVIILLSYKDGHLYVNTSNNGGWDHEDNALSFISMVNESNSTFLTERTKGKNYQELYKLEANQSISFVKGYPCCYFDDPAYSSQKKDYESVIKNMTRLEYIPINSANLSKEFKHAYGDVNEDKVINSSDALLVLQHSVGQITLTGTDFKAADVNKDNTVNSSDALKILQYSVGAIKNFNS